jgi:hypothetical protein
MPTTAVVASGRTGYICRQTGPYRSGRNARVVVIVLRGQRFPADTDGAVTTWTLCSQA